MNRNVLAKFSEIRSEIGSWALTLLIFVIPLQHEITSVRDILLFVILVCILAKIIDYREGKFILVKEFWKKSYLDYPLLLWIGSSILASFFSLEPNYSFYELRRTLLKQMIIYFGLTQLISSQKQIGRLTFSMVLVFLAIDIYGLIGYYTGWCVHDNPLPRAISCFIYPTNFAMMLDLVIPLFIFLTIKEPHLWFRSLSFVTLILSLVCLLLTFSRASWIAIFLTCVMLALVVERKIFWILTLVFLLSPLVLNYQGLQYAGSILDFSQYNLHGKIVGERITGWLASLQIIKKYPLFGSGYGIEIFPALFNLLYPEKIGKVLHAHNVFLQQTIEKGFWGLLSILWIFFITIKNAGKVFKKSNETYSRIVLLGLITGVLTLFMHGFVENFFNGTNMFFWFLIGLQMPLLDRLQKDKCSQIELKKGNL